MKTRSLAALGAWLLLLGCAGAPQRDDAQRAERGDVIERYNERTSRLDRLWARAVVSLEYTDEDGRRRNEQGEGHLQLLRPDRLALSVGKLGDVLVFLGCDAERYWWFDMAGDPSFVAIGRHENVGKECSRSLPIEAHPLDIIDLLGVTPLADEAKIIGRDERTIVVESPGRLGLLRLSLDSSTLLPRRIELFDRRDSRAASLIATLSDPQNVDLRGVGGFFPRTASRVVISHPESESTISLGLYDLSDGLIRGRIPEHAFDLSALAEMYRPELVAVLDEDCVEPAVRLP